MIKFYLKGKVLLTTKDFLFIITWLVLFLFIADAFANEPRIASYFIWVWQIMGLLYAFKIYDNFQMQKTDKPPILENGDKPMRVVKSRYFEA